MHITISYDGHMFYVCTTVDTDGSILTKPFDNLNSAMAYVTSSLKLAMKDSAKEEGLY